jgi:hypothetical protein
MHLGEQAHSDDEQGRSGAQVHSEDEWALPGAQEHFDQQVCPVEATSVGGGVVLSRI